MPAEFIRLDGGKTVAEAVAVLDQAVDKVVVEYRGDYWVYTRMELAGILRSADRSSPVGELLLRDHPPAHVAAPDTPAWRWAGWRVVFVDGDKVVGAAIDGPLQPVTAEAAPTRGLGRSREAATGAEAGEEGPARSVATGGEPVAGEGEPWNLETHFPRELKVGTTASLVVGLTKETTEGPDTSTLPVNVPAGTSIGVVVQAKRGFEIEGPAEGQLDAVVDALPLRFQLRANTEGTGVVRVLFFVEATALGAITLEPVIIAADGSADGTAVAASEVVSTFSVGAGRPDLELLVLEDGSGPRPRYSMRVTAADESLGIHLREFGPIELHTDARRFFAEIFADIEALDLSTGADRTDAQRLLESKGNYLFSTLLPTQLQTLLWDIRDRITRIRIDSEEPHIPWELIRLSGRDPDGSIVEDRFLCEYEFTRWIPGLGLHSDLTLADFGVVIPDDSGLESAQEEKAFLTALADPPRKVTSVPAAFQQLMDAFAAGTHDVWHFSGHGSIQDTEDPNRAAIQLADGQRFTPAQISGMQANLGRADPLIFFNACQIGRAAMSLTGLGGWAHQFLAAGAAGFVGAMWNVHDNPARDFAKTFYTRLLEGDAIGAATLRARNDIKQYQDATWLAYTVYGHPSAAMAGRE